MGSLTLGLVWGRSQRGIMSLPRYASRGAIRFLLHYVCRRAASHVVVLTAVLAAVGCAIGSQYAVKHLVDVLTDGAPSGLALWQAVCLVLPLALRGHLRRRLAL